MNTNGQSTDDLNDESHKMTSPMHQNDVTVTATGGNNSRSIPEAFEDF